ncbi:MAG: iron chelate uptake ABC transporter family permease subunit, partial [Anaeromassilibacillus sp.]
YEVILFEWFHIGDPATLAQGAVHDIVWYIRLPRIVLGVTVGMGLATVGVVMQAVVQNPLADPYILGISSGASLGATAAILMGIGAFGSNSVGVPYFWARWAYLCRHQAYGGRARRSNWSGGRGAQFGLFCHFQFIVYVADSQPLYDGHLVMGSLAGRNGEQRRDCFSCASGDRLFLTRKHTLNLMLLGRYGYHAGNQFAVTGKCIW